MSSHYLRFRPSHIAASALMLSMGINSSPDAGLVGLPAPQKDLYTQGVYSGMEGVFATEFTESNNESAAAARLS